MRWNRHLLLILLRAAVIISFGGLVAFSIGFYISQERELLKKTEARLSSFASFAAVKVGEWVMDQYEDAETIAEEPLLHKAILEFLKNLQEDHRRILKRTLQNLAEQHSYDNIVLFDKEKRVLLAAKDGVFLHHSDSMLLDKVLEQRRIVSSNLQGDADGKTHEIIVVPLMSYDGEVIGALMFQAELRLGEIMSLVMEPERNIDILLLGYEKGSIVVLSSFLARDSSQVFKIPLTEGHHPAVKAFKGAKGLLQGKNCKGEDIFAVSKEVPKTKWFVLVVERKDAVYKGWISKTIIAIVLFMALFGLVVFAFSLLWQGIDKFHYQNLYKLELDKRLLAEQHETVLRSIGDGVLVTDESGIIRFMNPVAERLTGWGEEEAKGRPIEEVFKIVNEESGNPAENPVKRVLQEGVVVGLANHTLLISRDGMARPIADSGAPVSSPDGSIKGVVLTFRDRTEERNMQRILADLERYYRTLVHSLHEDIIVVDRDYRITDVNNAVLHTLGVEREKIIGKCCYEVIHGYSNPCPLENEGHFCGLKEVLNKGKPLNLRHVHRDEIGSLRHIDVLYSPLKDETGAIVRVVLASRDVTDIVTVTDKLLASEEKFRKLFHYHSAIKLLIDPQDGSIVEANEAAVVFYGYGTSEIKTMKIHDIDVQGEELTSEIMKIVLGKGSGYFELLHRLADGTIKNVEVYSSRIDIQGKPYIHAIVHDITQRRKVELALMESEKKWRNILADVPLVGVGLDTEGKLVFANKHFLSITGWSEEEVLGKDWFDTFIPADIREEIKNVFHDIMEGRRDVVSTYENDIADRDGGLRTLAWFNVATRDIEGKIVEVTSLGIDLTEKKKAEAEKERLYKQLAEIQKLESIGRLAGGIAHDYNNMLNIIMGYVELIMKDLGPADPHREYINRIYYAAKRSADITRQLLTFARRQPISPRTINVNEIIEKMLEMLRNLVGEHIRLLWSPEARIWPVKMDPSQVDQIIMNLVLNSRDAIEGTGEITIETKNVEVDETYASRYHYFKPGSYVVISVSDTGKGMDKESLERIFEPFFTTKDVGEGTGLGLATVYGIVKQNSGYINAYSELGKGSIFRIYIPRVKADSSEAEEGLIREDDFVGGNIKESRVVVVEDDPLLLQLATEVLKRLGFTVFSVSNPTDVLPLLEKEEGKIDLLVSDVIMPDLDGRDLAENVISIYPHIKVLFMSGYMPSVLKKKSLLKDAEFIQKPFSIQEFAVKVNRLLRS